MNHPAPTPREHRPTPAWVGKSLFVIALIFLLKAAESLLVPVALALTLAFVLMPPLRRLRAAGVPQGLAAALLVTALLGATVLLGSTLVGPAAQWWERAPTTLAQVAAQVDRLRAAIPLLAPPPMPGRSAPRTPQPPQPDPVKERIASEGITMTGLLLGRMLAFGVSAAATVILLFFLLAAEDWLLACALEALPRRRTRARVLAGVRSVQREIGQFLGAQACINVGVGIVTSAAMSAIGLPNPVLWGTIAAGLNFVPYIGPVVIVALLFLAGIASFGGADLMLAPALAFVAIHAIEGNFVSPWLVGLRLRLSPIWVFVSVLFWGWLWGIAGAVLAVPILVGVRSVCVRNRRLRTIAAFLRGNHRETPSLRELLRSAPRP